MEDNTTMIVISKGDLKFYVSNAVEAGVKKVIDNYNLNNKREELLTSKEVARYFKKDVGTISRWVNKGTLVRHCVAGSRYFKLSEIEKVPQPEF